MALKHRPTFINDVDLSEGYTHFVFFDENGSAEYSRVMKNMINGVDDDDANHFQLTACIISVDDFVSVVSEITKTKNQLWPPNGMALYKNKSKKVCLHSSEIRYGKGPFHKNSIDREFLISELNNLMTNAKVKILSSYINKKKMIQNYSNPYDPYIISIEFLIEKLVKYETNQESKIMLIFEARNQIEDRRILKAINDFYENGTRFAQATLIQKKIESVYFNPKRPINDDSKSFFGLELADLCSYPLYRYCRYGTKGLDYQIVEGKMNSHSLKKFP